MDKKEQEKLQQKIFHDEFNNKQQKEKVERHNQTQNVRKEGITPINQKR